MSIKPTALLAQTAKDNHGNERINTNYGRKGCITGSASAVAIIACSPHSKLRWQSFNGHFFKSELSITQEVFNDYARNFS